MFPGADASGQRITWADAAAWAAEAAAPDDDIAHADATSDVSAASMSSRKRKHDDVLSPRWGSLPSSPSMSPMSTNAGSEKAPLQDEGDTYRRPGEDVAISYVCIGPEIPGKMDAAKAKALGVPRGPDMGRGVVRNPDFLSWIAQFPASTKHIIAADDASPDEILLHGTSALQHELASVDSNIFVPPYESSQVPGP
ncbi:hypothetical protein HK405_001669, partial [Cladochytrium tenue]